MSLLVDAKQAESSVVEKYVRPVMEHVDAIYCIVEGLSVYSEMYAENRRS